MTHPTALDTNAIRQRLEKITPGEWTPRAGCNTDVESREIGQVAAVEMPEDADFIAHAPADIAALLADNQRLREALEKAAPHVCENLCPSKWRTADGPPPHHETCRQITDALKAKEGDTP